MPERISGLRNQIRGEVLSELCIARSVHVLNEPSECFTSHGPLGASDIDITIVNRGAISLLEFVSKWVVKGGWSVSDHHIIKMVMSNTRSHPAALAHFCDKLGNL